MKGGEIDRDVWLSGLLVEGSTLEAQEIYIPTDKIHIMIYVYDSVCRCSVYM